MDLKKIESICKIILLISLILATISFIFWPTGRYVALYRDGTPSLLLDTTTGNIYKRGKVRQRFEIIFPSFSEEKRPTELAAPAPAPAPVPVPAPPSQNRDIFDEIEDEEGAIGGVFDDLIPAK